MKLVNPTVRELIATLKELPQQDCPIFMKDADTEYTVHIFHIAEKENRVEMWGEYSEMKEMYPNNE